MSLQRGWARLYYNVSLIDCDSKETLDDLLNSADLGRFVVARISDRAILVDGQQKAATTRLLARRGQPYRVTDLVPQVPSEDDAP